MTEVDHMCAYIYLYMHTHTHTDSHIQKIHTRAQMEEQQSQDHALTEVKSNMAESTETEDEQSSRQTV